MWHDCKAGADASARSSRAAHSAPKGPSRGPSCRFSGKQPQSTLRHEKEIPGAFRQSTLREHVEHLAHDLHNVEQLFAVDAHARGDEDTWLRHRRLSSTTCLKSACRIFAVRAFDFWAEILPDPVVVQLAA